MKISDYGMQVHRTTIQKSTPTLLTLPYLKQIIKESIPCSIWVQNTYWCGDISTYNQILILRIANKQWLLKDLTYKKAYQIILEDWNKRNIYETL